MADQPSSLGWTGSAALIKALARAVHALDPQPSGLAVALSGGTDSAMLAVHAHQFAQQHTIPLHFLHVHHGLQAIADQWQSHVHDLAHRLRVPCHSVRVQVDLGRGDGMEAAARNARYDALAAMAQHIGVQHVLLAHHQDDQAETVLLRLLRGAGPSGLGAMAPLLERGQIKFLRPWLDVPRADLVELADDYAAHTGWHPVSDPTNADDLYTRAAVRERLAPQLDVRWPGWQRNLVRHARLSRDMAEVLDEVAEADFAQLDPDSGSRSFSLERWRELSGPRQSLVLRYWLGRHGLGMPTEARLHDLMRQLRSLHALGHDRQMRVRHAGVDIVCVRGRVQLGSRFKNPLK